MERAAKALDQNLSQFVVNAVLDRAVAVLSAAEPAEPEPERVELGPTGVGLAERHDDLDAHSAGIGSFETSAG